MWRVVTISSVLCGYMVMFQHTAFLWCWHARTHVYARTHAYRPYLFIMFVRGNKKKLVFLLAQTCVIPTYIISLNRKPELILAREEIAAGGVPCSNPPSGYLSCTLLYSAAMSYGSRRYTMGCHQSAHAHRALCSRRVHTHAHTNDRIDGSRVTAEMSTDIHAKVTTGQRALTSSIVTTMCHWLIYIAYSGIDGRNGHTYLL